MNKTLPPAYGLLVSLVCGVAAARPDPAFFHIESQPLASAINAWVAQTGYQVLMPMNDTETYGATAPLRGQLEPEAALRALLAGTGLQYQFVNARTVAIRQASVDSTGGRAPAANGEGEIAQVVVTAQKRQERAIDVPISMVAMGAEELATRRITSIDALSIAVPGLAVQSDGGFQRQIALRGVSNYFGRSPLIGMYIDEASVTSYSSYSLPDVRTYDLERIEVLRGPQGTLYGDGSIGGTIRFITKSPELDRLSANADIEGAYTQDGGPSGHIDGVVNIPLIDDQLGVRVAGIFDEQGGWMDQPAAGREDFNDSTLSEVRAKGLWKPSEQLSVGVMGLFHRWDGAPSTGEDGNGNYLQVFNLTTTPDASDDYDLFNLTVTYDLPVARLLGTSSYIDQDKALSNYGTRRQFSPPGTTPLDVYAQRTQSTQALTQELRLSSIEADAAWQWTFGGYYRDIRYKDLQLTTFGAPTSPSGPFPTPSNDVSKSWAAFGDTSYRLTDRFTLGTGLRYFEDEKTNRVTTAVGKFHTLNRRFYLQYRIAADVNVYASAAKGFRSGGFNSSLNRPNYGPESVWSYEVGTKMALAQGRVTAEVALFRSTYSDYVINGIVLNPPVNIASNAGDAKVRGVEASFVWRPAREWELSANGDYIDSEFTEVNAGSAAFIVGDPLDGFPRYHYTVSGQRNFKWNGRSGFARIDYNEQGPMTYRSRNVAGPSPWYFSESDVINMLNLNLTLRWTDNLSVRLFGQNLLNDRGFISADVIDELSPRARPRTWGMGFSVGF